MVTTVSMAYGKQTFADMLISGDYDFVSISTAVTSKTELYTAPTAAAQKIMRMAALDGRQRCLHEHVELSC